MTQTIDVSGEGPAGASFAATGETNASWPEILPGRGIPGRGLPGVDRLAPLHRVGVAQERIERDVHEIRVAEIAFPVGERELEGLRNRMEVRIRAVPLLAYARRLGDGKRFQQERALAPRAAGVHLDLLVAQLKAARDRGHDLAAEGLEIVRREKPVVLPLMREDLARDVAPVERMTHRREAGHAVVAGRALLIAEELQGPAQIGLDQPLARRRHLAAGHPDCGVLRPLAELVGVLAHVVEHDRVTGKAFAMHSAPRAPPRRGMSSCPIAPTPGCRHRGRPARRCGAPRAEWFPRGVR